MAKTTKKKSRPPEPTVELPRPPGADSDPFLVVGWDQSTNHGGIVVLDNLGDLVDFFFLADRAMDAKKRKGAARIPNRIKAYKEKGVRDCRRLVWVGRWLAALVNHLHRIADGRPVYMAIEDYAYGASGQVYQIAEVVGSLKGTALTHPGGKFRLRLYDPMSVKLFAANHGHADKEDMRLAAMKNWGADFDQYGPGPEEDLCDALALAVMAWTEAHVRAGRLNLSDLPEGQRRIFLRTTKTYPVNVLDRDWVTLR